MVERRRHLLIAGTGRAGTSFLVRYLAELGLETQLSRGPASSWCDVAQAGLEDNLLPILAADPPYVVKQPWSYQMIDEALADPAVALDGVIIPIRDLTEAAASRTVVEIQALHKAIPWMAQLDRTWEDWGRVPGGAIYALDPVDQARLLAVGLHRLLERLVRADVPVTLLAFPRLVEDADYLFAKLRAFIPPEISLAAARQAHARVADLAKVRLGRELQEADPACRDPRRDDAPSFAALDNIAMRRELVRMREQLAIAEAANRGWLRRLAGRLRRLRSRRQAPPAEQRFRGGMHAAAVPSPAPPPG
jgi:hypothetical protein